MPERDIMLVGVPLEKGTERRGCLMGPDAFRTAGLAEALADLGHAVRDFGNLQAESVSFCKSSRPVIKNLPEIAGWTRSLYANAQELGGQRLFPIYLGGDHALSAGTVSGLSASAASQDRPLFVLWLDAHSDFNTLETTLSGNLHGTPLAFVCGLPGFESYLGKALEHPVDPARVEILGVRSIDVEERALLLKHGVRVSDMRRIDEIGIPALIGQFLSRVKAENGLLHVSLDVDFLDPEIAPAVGTTVPGGATFREAHLVMELLHDSGLVTSLDLVELNPFLDDRGKTARLMVDLTCSLFGKSVFDRPTRSF